MEGRDLGEARTVTLCDEGSGRNRFRVCAAFESGRLSVKGDDFGLFPLRRWGALTYRYHCDFDEENTKTLAEALAPAGGDWMEELKRRFGGTAACLGLREFCAESGIRYRFGNLSVSTPEDREWLRASGSSDGPAFESLQHAFDMTGEYRSHPTPEHAGLDGPYGELSGEAFLIAYFRDRGVTEEEIEWYRRWGCFGGCWDLAPNVCGMESAKARADGIIAYRSATIEDIDAERCAPPWEWRYAKKFLPAGGPNGEICLCCYQGKTYYYGIAKEEVPITEEMRKNGSWYVYDWCD